MLPGVGGSALLLPLPPPAARAGPQAAPGGGCEAVRGSEMYFSKAKGLVLLIILPFWGNDEGSEPGNGFSAVQFGSPQHPPDPRSTSTPYPSPCSLHPPPFIPPPSSCLFLSLILHPLSHILHLLSPPPFLLPPPHASFTPYLVPFTPQPTSSTLYPLPFTLRPILPLLAVGPTWPGELKGAQNPREKGSGRAKEQSRAWGWP